MYLDSFEALMGRIDHLYVIDESQKNILPLFDLNKLNEQAGKTQSPQAQPKGQ
jgi:hypothetical protein